MSEDRSNRIPKTTVIIEFEEEIYKHFKQQCKNRKKSLSFIINEALENHIKFAKFTKEKKSE